MTQKARIIDGQAISQRLREQLREQIQSFKQTSGFTPGLAAVLVGNDPASQVYVRNKRRACDQVGITSWLHRLEGTTGQAELLELVQQLNADRKVHGILVQLPLPRHIDEQAIIDGVIPTKDVDGLCPENLGLLAAGRPRFLPCTPHGVQQMLVLSDIRIAGSHVVVIGRSNIVGKSLGLILLGKGPGGDATVTICHSQTPNISALTRQADIVVVAIGRPRFLKAEMVRPGAAVIDVGINRVDGKLVGDADFESLLEVAGSISPVPGGVGPMTITMLLSNTLQAARKLSESSSV